MLFTPTPLTGKEIQALSLRLLANLGDAVCNLYERERAVMTSSSAEQMHLKVKARVNAKAQALFLGELIETLTDEEKDIVRRARNLKVGHYGRTGQATYRQSTAFEVLVGFLYLSDSKRLSQIFSTLEGGKADTGQPAKP
jgi:ribonuclease III family protein